MYFVIAFVGTLFLVSFVLWPDELFQVNFVSKNLQGEKIDLSTAMDLFNNLVSWLRKLRVDRFVLILVTAKELAEDMEVVCNLSSQTSKEKAVQ